MQHLGSLGEIGCEVAPDPFDHLEIRGAGSTIELVQDPFVAVLQHPKEEPRQGGANGRAVPELHVQVRRVELYDGVIGVGADEGS